MAGAYLEQFLESIQTLPADVSRNLLLVAELDTHVEELMKKTSQLATNYTKEARELNGDLKNERIATILELCEKASRYSEDKLELVSQAYNMVDKHIRRLDTEMAKIDTNLVDLEEVDKQPISINPNKKKKVKVGKGKEKAVVLQEDITNKSGRKKKVLNPGRAARTKTIKETECLDMEVDPNEPLYCICQQVSFGEMVCCDDAECSIEWFHFACMGLTVKPKGKWFCPSCIAKKKSAQQ